MHRFTVLQYEGKMKEYEIIFASCNLSFYAKRITAYIVEPDVINQHTGLLHFAHGWGGNRYGYREMQRELADRFNLLCVATEYRQSGYDFDADTGLGAYVPYDASHYQVIDCLNAVRRMLEIYPGIDRRRIMAFGASQGGHISLLMAIFCPDTFACVIASSPITYLDPTICGWAGRDFSEDEKAIRDVVRMADRIKCPVALNHGTSDETVPHEHTGLLASALQSMGKTVRVRYYEGADHALSPVTDRAKAALEIAGDWLEKSMNTARDDFKQGSKIVIRCVTKSFVLDWSKPIDDFSLACWQ
jgi:dienelactone hydrolase